jgi:diguanylate cyclase (GGDEF)-like protein/PAS domain S-box-containing protein
MHTTRSIPHGSAAPWMWALLMMVAGGATLVGAMLTAPNAAATPAVMATGAVLAICGAIGWFVPWRRRDVRLTLFLPAISVVVVAAQLALGPEPAVGIRVGIALLVAGVTGEAMAWRAERRRQDELRIHAEHSDELMRSLVQTATDATLVIDIGGAIISASPSATTALGYAVDDLLQSNVQGLVSADDAAAILAMHGTVAHGSAGRIDCQVLHHDGRWLRAEIAATNLPDDQGLVLTIHDVTRWKELEEQLRRQAFHDPLTNLANRALYVDRLEHALGRRRHHTKGAAVLFLDLDDFKTVNDTLGHVEGDHLIRQVAARLLDTIRPEDTAARLGGDEFALLLEDVDEDQAIAVANRVIGALDRPFDLSDRPMRIGTTIGIALSSPDLPTATDMLRAADIAMYEAKDAGKGRFRVFEPAMQLATAERLQLSVDLRGAVERSEFVLHYQPTVSLPSATITGVEALVRWAHPLRGLVPPLEFIPLAERTGLIIPLGEWVLREACRQAQAWRLARPDKPPLMMSVNLSGVQLRHPGLVATVSLALEDSGLPPELLTLEITESVLAHETEDVIRRLRQLKGLGVCLAIDDFGTGYSSLSYLRRFPIDLVKIDKSFVDGIATGTDEAALARAIVRLAHSLKIKTVAEGVELEGQAKGLSRMGSDQAQGFYFARPMDVEAATAHLVGHTTLSLWVGHSGHELEVIKSVVADFEVASPGLRVEVTGAVSGDRIVAALAGGTAPNVVSSFESDNFGVYFSDGGLIDLGPYMVRDGIDEGLLTDATQAYTRRSGRRWALPMLADTYGLFANDDQLAALGVTGPPRTTDELADLARRLTTRNADGSLRVVGFNPMIDFYENSVAILGQMFGARWADETGRSMIATDPAWARMLTWQKALVDWYGHADLVAFEATAGREFTAANAFQAGRLAMCVDGEWRVAFIGAEAPELKYRASPVPVDPALPDAYGSGYINGSVIGIPARSQLQDESWKLVKYLATDDRALVKLSNGLRNVPSTKSALRSSGLLPDDHFAVFLDIFAHPRSSASPVTSAGSTYEGILTAFALRWQAGQVADLQAGLREVDRDIDTLLRRATAGIKRLERPAA